ncbi:uncharacterized protein LOC107265717 isoform X7 [Cephus cinctus]|uniref:Uncharacterized protein LOC107265717 isoform X7 n=1 Tax=Cephus cinctus TaxID=211228 RepID=A0AAJ7BPB6_CEPCN|nr:uncharacterized protein LOC107265717 isoform X7 [Cephus cinctus]
MNNPFRARPSRSRVDPAVVGFETQSQTVYGTVPTLNQPAIPTNNVYQHQAPVTNQLQQSSDPWVWGSENVNNGNDSWNWSVDQSTDSQPQQQQQFVPTYTNNGQPATNPVPNNYYKNLNGNNRAGILNQYPSSGKNTPGSASRESTPNHSDSYSHYTNYSFNQHYPTPPRPNSAKSSTGHSDHSQWSTEQQPQSIPYVQPTSAMLNQKNQTPPLPPPVNSYNWNNVDQQTISSTHTWQNHTNAPTSSGGYFESNVPTEGQHVENMGNNWHQQMVQHIAEQHPQVPVTVPAPSGKETGSNDRSANWSSQHQERETSNSWSSQGNVSSNQWPNQNSESNVPPQWQPTILNQSEQPGSINLTQQWQQPNVQHDVQPNQWIQHKPETSNIPEDIPPQEITSNKLPSNDWQQVQPPSSHFHSSSGSTASGSTLNLANNADRQDEQNKIATFIGSSTSLNDIPAQTQINPMLIPEQKDWAVPDTNLTSDNSEKIPAQNKTETNWNSDGEWNTIPVSELSSGFNELSLVNKPDKNLENQNSQMETCPPHSGDWTSHSTSSFCPSNTNNDTATPDNIGSSEVSNPVESQPIAQEHSLNQTYQTGNSKTTENVSQAGYDQWYNRNTPAAQPEGGWYANDRARPQKQWSPEQNVENYENIQQSSEFVNLEVVAPVLQERDIYGSRDSINRETLDNDPKLVSSPSKETATSRDFRQEANNVEVPALQQPQPPLQVEQAPDNYEFASNDRNTFLETGELTDSHQEHEPTPPSQDDENDEVPNDIPFLREVPGQSSSTDPRRNDPTGQEQYVQTPRTSDPRRNDPSGQEQSVLGRNIPERTERRDVPSGQERNIPLLSRGDSDTLERRNDPSGRERSLPPQQSRNDPSGEERIPSQSQTIPEPAETREVPGRGNETEDPVQQTHSGIRQIPGGASPNESVQIPDDRSDARVVTGSQEVATSVPMAAMQDPPNESRNKREEAVGASVAENSGVPGPPNRRDSYEDGDDEGSGNSRDESRDRRRDGSPSGRRYDYDRKGRFYDRDREYEEDYFYDRRRGPDYERAYNSREDLDRRDPSYRDDDRRHPSRDDLDRRGREDVDRRVRGKDDPDDSRRRLDDRRRDRVDDPRRRDRDPRNFDPRFPRDRDYPDRDRRRDDRRRRYDEYETREPFRREYYDDPYGRGSRPSSRSSYNDRDRDYYLRARDPYYAYNGYGGYDYGTNYNNNYYAYFDNLRRTNPVAYAEWYNKYYANQHQQSQAARNVGSYTEDRASVHSGRSSCDDRITGDKRTLDLLEDSLNDAPRKFFTAHVLGSFTIGSLLHVYANNPTDGEKAKVDIFRVDSLTLHDPVARELRAYPGPLIKGVTHKKTIIEYCENKIKKADVNEDMDDSASYILLYELMIMLIQQNGNVVGVDIAALLLRNKDAYPYDANKQHVPVRRESVMSQRSGSLVGEGSVHEGSTSHEKEDANKPKKPLTVEQMTNEFRDTLLYGLVQEALEYAMDQGLWGHALFLASKLDKRTHASVMTRFANSLPAHDPLQTLYQLHSGRVPASVTCVADPKWDDWRPHLAMIISNTSANPEINRRSITTLGDTLAARGNIHGAHFCYILAQIDFGPYGASAGKLVLIGSNHNKPYSEFVTLEAVMLTEIYEYARNLSEPGFTLADLQTFKFDLAVKMVDYGLIEKALLYIEQIAVNITNEPAKYKRSFIEQVYTIGDRIKYHDPVCKDSLEDAANLAWLNNLSEIVGKCQTGEIIQDDLHDPRTVTDMHQTLQTQKHHEIQQQQHKWSVAQPDYSDGPTSLMEGSTMDPQSEWQPMSLPTNIQDPYNPSSQYVDNSMDPSQYQQNQHQQDYWNQQTYSQQDYSSQDYTQADWQTQQAQAQYPSEQTDADNQQQDKWNYESEKEEKSATPEVSNPTLALRNSGMRLGASDNLLRRRKTIIKPEPSNADRTAVVVYNNDNNVNNEKPLLQDTYCAYKDTKVKSDKCQQSLKYPKVTMSYPKIFNPKKVHPENPPRVKRIDPRVVRPPLSKPPVFLKCKPKKNELLHETTDEDSEHETENESISKGPTDLDIQFGSFRMESLNMSCLPSDNQDNSSLSTTNNRCKTLKEYCNFDENNALRIAPHIHRRDIICDTVDAWCDVNDGHTMGRLNKPLIFGGTFPIDIPLISGSIKNSPTSKGNALAGKNISKTFDIDAPVGDN